MNTPTPSFRELLTMNRVKDMLIDLVLGKPDPLAPLGSSELGDMLEFLQDQRNEIEVLITHFRKHYEKASAQETVERPEKLIEARMVTVPSRDKHEGVYSKAGYLFWVCPVCGGPRGTLGVSRSYDGSMSLLVNAWNNPCGHVDKYPAVREEMRTNGLNITHASASPPTRKSP